MVTGRYHNTSSVTDMLQSLDWRTLEQRRVDQTLYAVQLRNRQVAVEEERYVHVHRGTGMRSHQYRRLGVDRYYIRLSEKIIQWNQLSSQTCMARSLDTFWTQVAKIEHSRLN